MVDKHLVLRKISELEQYLIQIREFSDISISKYSREWEEFFQRGDVSG